LAIDNRMPARLLDEAVDLGQPQPAALANFLSGEERLENAAEMLLSDAEASVADRQHQVVAGIDALEAGNITLVEMHVRGLDDQLATLRHGIARVEREVEEGGLELVGIDPARPCAAGGDRFDPDRLAERPRQHLQHADDEVIEIDALWRQRLPASE